MVEVKEKEQAVRSGVFGSFFSLNDLAQIAGVLTATEKLSELADEMDSNFGEVAICREVVRGVRRAITAIHTMGGMLYSVPVAQRMLNKYDVELGAWTRFKMGARFYARRVVIMWILASLLSAAAAALLVARFAIAAYGVAMGTVPVAALGYMAAAIGGVCLPLAACAYMLKQIKFAHDRFVESVKVAKAIAHERTGVGVIDEQEDHLPSAYFAHSVSDYDLRKSRQLVWLSSICLTISVVSLCTAFLLDALFPLKGVSATAVGAVAPNLTLWYDFVVVGLSFMVGALLVVFGSSQFLQDDVALAQLKKAILETVDARVLLRGNDTNLATAARESDSCGVDLDLIKDSGAVCASGFSEEHVCCDSDLIVSTEDGVHVASGENAFGDCSLALSDSGRSGSPVSQQEVIENAHDAVVSPDKGVEPSVDAAMVTESAASSGCPQESEEDLLVSRCEEATASELHDATVEPTLLNAEREVA